MAIIAFVVGLLIGLAFGVAVGAVIVSDAVEMEDDEIVKK